MKNSKVERNPIIHSNNKAEKDLSSTHYKLLIEKKIK